MAEYLKNQIKDWVGIESDLLCLKQILFEHSQVQEILHESWIDIKQVLNHVDVVE